MEDWKYAEARKRVKRIKGFYSHFASWLIFSVFMIILNFSTDPHEFWAIFPIMAWGIGVAFHALGVFGFPGLGRNWEERLMEQELERIEREEEIRQWAAESSRNHVSPSDRHYAVEDPKLELRKLDRRPRDSDFV